jgi:hypothetical protein
LAQSNFDKLDNLDALTSYPYYKSGAFWITTGFTLSLIVSMIWGYFKDESDKYRRIVDRDSRFESPPKIPAKRHKLYWLLLIWEAIKVTIINLK